MKKRVRIPRNAAQVVALAKRVKDKHIVDGDASVLHVLNWSVVGPVVDEAVALQESTDQLKREMLESYQKRDLKIDVVVKFLRNSRDVLTGAYDPEMKTLGQWGFDVLDVRLAKATAPPDAVQQKALAEHSA